MLSLWSVSHFFRWGLIISPAGWGLHYIVQAGPEIIFFMSQIQMLGLQVRTGIPEDVGVIDCTGTPEDVGVIGCALSHPWMLEL